MLGEARKVGCQSADPVEHEIHKASAPYLTGSPRGASRPYPTSVAPSEGARTLSAMSASTEHCGYCGTPVDPGAPTTVPTYRAASVWIKKDFGRLKETFIVSNGPMHKEPCARFWARHPEAATCR